MSENSEPKVYKEAIKKENIDELTKSFLGFINDEDGSGKLAEIEGISILGKTGTAEIKKDKEDNTGSENGWFVALNSNDSNIVISMIIEDVKNKGGSEYVIPKVKNSIESYLKR